jgi:hypothetical protein
MNLVARRNSLRTLSACGTISPSMAYRTGFVMKVIVYVSLNSAIIYGLLESMQFESHI